ncbi:hypothetical protein JCM1841_000970 [Sporobolomyces salmonicolor]
MGANTWNFTNGSWPSDPHYADHRFSDGLTWGEFLAQGLNVPLEDYAVAGATTNNSLVQGWTGRDLTFPVPSILNQIAQYLARIPDRSEQTLFILFGGMSDFLFGGNGADPSGSAASLGSGMHQLTDAGAQYLLLCTLPSPLGWPYLRYNPFALRSLSNFTSNFRTALYGLDTNPNQTTLSDMRALFTQIYSDPEIYAFSPEKLGEACLVGPYDEAPNVTVCDAPSEYVWWDEFNPSNATQFYMASLAFSTLKRVGWVQ